MFVFCFFTFVVYWGNSKHNIWIWAVQTSFFRRNNTIGALFVILLYLQVQPPAFLTTSRENRSHSQSPPCNGGNLRDQQRHGQAHTAFFSASIACYAVSFRMTDSLPNQKFRDVTICDDTRTGECSVRPREQLPVPQNIVVARRWYCVWSTLARYS